MTKLLVDRALLEQALKAIHTGSNQDMVDAEDALRTALNAPEVEPADKQCKNCTFYYRDYDMKPCSNCERGDNIEDNWMPMSSGQVALNAAPTKDTP